MANDPEHIPRCKIRKRAASLLQGEDVEQKRKDSSSKSGSLQERLVLTELKK